MPLSLNIYYGQDNVLVICVLLVCLVLFHRLTRRLQRKSKEKQFHHFRRLVKFSLLITIGEKFCSSVLHNTSLMSIRFGNFLKQFYTISMMYTSMYIMLFAIFSTRFPTKLSNYLNNQLSTFGTGSRTRCVYCTLHSIYLALCNLL